MTYVKFKRSTYPDIPGVKGSPCWTATGRWLYFDADWNTRRPYGTSLCLRLQSPHWPDKGPGFTLDVNPPLGEPNRLYLFLWRRHVIIGLPSVRDFRETSRETGPRGIRVIHGVHFSNWRHPHIDGCSRYEYHQVNGEWVRDAKPAPFRWGWLTIYKPPVQ